MGFLAYNDIREKLINHDEEHFISKIPNLLTGTKTVQRVHSSCNLSYLTIGVFYEILFIFL